MNTRKYWKEAFEKLQIVFLTTVMTAAIAFALCL